MIIPGVSITLVLFRVIYYVRYLMSHARSLDQLLLIRLLIAHLIIFCFLFCSVRLFLPFEERKHQSTYYTTAVRTHDIYIIPGTIYRYLV